MFARLRDQVTLYFEDFGRGVPLLCLPAFPFDHAMYREQYALEDVARLILPDYRGTGRSQLTEGPYTMDMLALDMFALLDHRRVERTVVLGLSMGAYVAFAMYALHPERFQGLVLADSRAEADSPAAAERRRQTVLGLHTVGAGSLRDRVRDLFAFASLRERPDLVEAMQLAVLQQPAEGLAQLTLGMLLRPDRTDLLPRINVPTLVLGGDGDVISPPEEMRRMAGRIAGAEFHVVPQAGHLAALEQPIEFNRLVREFLNSKCAKA